MSRGLLLSLFPTRMNSPSFSAHMAMQVSDDVRKAVPWQHHGSVHHVGTSEGSAICVSDL